METSQVPNQFPKCPVLTEQFYYVLHWIGAIVSCFLKFRLMRNYNRGFPQSVFVCVFERVSVCYCLPIQKKRLIQLTLSNHVQNMTGRVGSAFRG